MNHFNKLASTGSALILSSLYLCLLAWKSANNAGVKTWRGIAASGDGTIIAAVVLGGNFWISTDKGVNWSDHDNVNITSNPWQTVAMSDDGNNLIIGAFGSHLWYSSDGGKNFDRSNYYNSTTDLATAKWQSVACSKNCSNIIAAANDGAIYMSTDYGVHFSTHNNAGYNWWTSVASDGMHFFFKINFDF
jgi:photosystem II stability/assembly factor-like uncharacterized protein